MQSKDQRAIDEGARPFFSVVVACCDVEDYLRECFDSLLAQEFTDWEAVVCVEESKDGTERIAREFAARDARFRVFCGPRTGSCSVPRNRGVEEAAGEYVIFVDGDDAVAEGSFRRLHDKIAARPGADLYPGAVRVVNELTGREEPTRDNFARAASPEMTGQEAIVAAKPAAPRHHPDMFMQMTACRRAFLAENGLRCIPGLRRQDWEFTPRAYFLARRVVPVHEPFYVYKVRRGSVSTKFDGGERRFVSDHAAILRSLLAFHETVAVPAGVSPAVQATWAKRWIGWIAFLWFDPANVRATPRDVRATTLGTVFADGFRSFDALRRASCLRLRVLGWWIEQFAKRPAMRPLCELFFRAYFAATWWRRG